jgi:hypothetical protein
MALQHLPLTAIDEAQLIRLIAAQVAETRDIEYKRDTYGTSDADHAEWLADVSSFANAGGGDLIIGVRATQGVPQALSPLTDDPDAEVLRLEQIARAGLQPRISNLQFRTVSIAAGGYVLVVRVPRSFNPPHRVVRQGKGQNRFWARSSAGKYEPNVDELRALFTLAPQLAERMRDFRADRVAQIVADRGPVELMHPMRMIMHVVPFSSFDPRSVLSLEQIKDDPTAFPPMGSTSASNWQINIDGVLRLSNADHRAISQRAYTQVYRNGTIESVASIGGGDRPHGVPPRLTSIKIEGMLLTASVRYIKRLHAMGIEPPYVIFLSLVGTKGAAINVGLQADWAQDDDTTILTKDQLHFGEVILETVPQSIQEMAMVAKPLIEQIANAAGRANSASFGPRGEYLHIFN